MSGVLGIVAMVIFWIVMAALNKAHRDETGVNMPTRRQYKNIRRNARRKGVSLNQAGDEWLKREQKKQGLVAPSVTHATGTGDVAARVLEPEPEPYRPKPYPPEMFRAGSKQPPPFPSRRSSASDVAPSVVRAGEPARVVEARSKGGIAAVRDGVHDLDIRVARHVPDADKPAVVNFEFEFNCTQCGGWIVSAPDRDDEQATCKACSIPFGSLAAVKAKCNEIGLAYMKEHRLGAFAEP